MILKSMTSLRQGPQRQCMRNKCRMQEKILLGCEIFNRLYPNNLASEEHRSSWMAKDQDTYNFLLFHYCRKHKFQMKTSFHMSLVWYLFYSLTEIYVGFWSWDSQYLSSIVLYLAPLIYGNWEILRQSGWILLVSSKSHM